jgi:hypothetical protein
MPDPSSVCLFGCLLPLALVMMVAAPSLALREYRQQVSWSPRSRTRARVRAVLNVLCLETLSVGVLLFVLYEAMWQPIVLGTTAPWLSSLSWLIPTILALGGALGAIQSLLDRRERRRRERQALSRLAPDDDPGVLPN